MGFVKFLLLIIFLVIAFFTAFRFPTEKEKKEKDLPFFLVKKHSFSFGVFLIIIGLLVIPSIGAIPAGHRGVVVRLGAVTGRILNEGIYMVKPLIENVKLMDVRVQAYSEDAASASKDLQEVRTKVTLNYFLLPHVVARIYQNLGDDYQRRIINPAIQEAVKASTALYEAEKLIVERSNVRDKIIENLKARLEIHGIMVEALSITDFSFSEEFTRAIEAKVTASQLALKAERDLERIKMEAEQKIATARAEAEALRLQKEMVTDKLIELRKVEVQKLALEKWDGHLPTFVGSDNVPILATFGDIKKSK
jgi:prohibitin 2